MVQITFKGSPVHTCGRLPEKGAAAPDFELCDTDLKNVGLKDFKGRTLVLSILPSLETSVCQASAKRFNDLVASLENVAIANVSMDLPFAQGRFCGAENLDNMENLSAFRSPDFGMAYGVTITDGPLQGLLSRAVVVIGPDGTIQYTEQVPEIAQEPDYEALIQLFD